MCGIAGILSFDGRPVSRQRIEASTETIQHRGPDNLAVWTNGNVAFGHTRLSIVDLSTSANQPLHLPARQLSMVYNGEVYNFKELRTELEAGGANFQTTSDTEVIIHAYAQWGTDCFARLNGIFAIAIWDDSAQELTLARDRLGVKPLYFCHHNQELAFGSEIKTILTAMPELPRTISPKSLHEFMYFGVSLGGKAMFDGIDQVQSATIMQWTADGKIKNSIRFWNYPTTQQRIANEAETIEQTSFHMEQAVRRQLTGDVPIGVFLSGGLDSSSITGFAAKNYSGKLKTFSVAFDFAPSSELGLARQVAKMHDTEHHEIQVGGLGLADLVQKLVHCHDSPFADAANIPLYLLCEKISGQLKVVLQGDGGDELFGGYRRYATLAKPAKFRLFSQALRIPGLRKLIPWRFRRYLECWLPGKRSERMARLLTLEMKSEPPTNALSRDLQIAVRRSDPFQRYHEIENEVKKLGDVEAMLATDMQIILPDVFLEKVDRSTMAHGVEVRVPLLENSLIDFVATLPSELKVKNGEQKWLLRQAIKNVVPDEVLTGKKLGFGVPYSQWMREPLKELLRDQLTSLAEKGVTQSAVTDAMVKSHEEGSEQYGFLLWKLMNLGVWLNQYNVVPQT